jgi:ATP-binding cassette subfamily B protein
MPIFQLGMIGAMLSRAEASAERIFEVVDAQSEVEDKPDAFTLPPLLGRVSFEAVSFRYIGGDQDVINGVSFKAEPGETIAILGQTGAGKSSIINLIPRFYDVTGGQVLIDGNDVRDITLDSLRSQIGIVLQETTLFSGSIRDNIAYGRPEASMEEIIAAAKAAQAHDFIAELEDGYQSEVAERGVGLSGGQKQRIAIARALLVDPRILILDDSTCISTVRNANKILVLDKGKLAAVGTHQELMETNELYVEILETQFGDRVELMTVVAEEMSL